MGFYDGNSLWTDAIALFIIQVLLIVILSRVLHFFLSRIFREPMVIAELIAGILLGPSAFGQIPGFTSTIFPASSLVGLSLMAQTGLIFFMLLVGMELDAALFRRNIIKSGIISACGICFPFAGGIGVGVWLYNYQGSTVSRGLFLVYIGVAIAITAFPVLARILAERNLTSTRIGMLALSAAAVDDVTAWCMLALVISLVSSSNSLGALWTVLTGIGWTLFMFLIFKPTFAFILRRYKLYHKITPLMVAFLICGTFISAWLTDEMGIHVIFGAFLFGLCIPRENHFAHNFTKRIEELIIVFFVPIYFTNSGLNVDITQLRDGTGWAILVVVTITAIVLKVVGCFVPTYFLTKLNFKESLSVGFLMSTKGLVELIVLNLGYSLKVINQIQFTIMVLMALITTFITSPVVACLYPKRLMLLRERANFKKGSEFSVLLCISNRPEALKLLMMAKNWIALNKKNSVNALRLIPVDDRPSTYFNWGQDEDDESDLDEIEMDDLSQTINEVDESKVQRAKAWISNKVSFSSRTRNTTAPSGDNGEAAVTSAWLNKMTFGLYGRTMGENPEEDTVVSSIKESAKACQMKVSVIRKVSSNVKQDICNVALTRRADMTILGDGELKRGKSASPLENLLSSPVVGYVLGHARETNVGVFVSASKKQPASIDGKRRALVIYYGENNHDYIVIKLARQMAKESKKNTSVVILYAKKWEDKKDGDSSDEEDYQSDDDMHGYDTASDSEDEDTSTSSKKEKKDKKKKKKKEKKAEKKEGDVESGVPQEGNNDDSSSSNDTTTVNETTVDDETTERSSRRSSMKIISTPEEKEERRWLRKDPLLKDCLRKRKAIKVVARRKGESLEEAVQRVAAEGDSGLDKGEFGLLVVGIGTKMGNARDVEWLLTNPITPMTLLVRQAKSILDGNFYEDEEAQQSLLDSHADGEEGKKDKKKTKRVKVLGKSIKSPKAVISNRTESATKFFKKYVSRGNK